MATKEQRLEFRDIYEDLLREVYEAMDVRNGLQRIKRDVDDKQRGGA